MVEKEALLKKFHDDIKTDNAEEIKYLSKHIRDDYYRRLVLFHPKASMEKDIYGTMWKNCFYKQIDEYRKNLRSIETILVNHGLGVAHEYSASARMNEGKFKYNEDTIRQLQVNVMKLTQEFINFIESVSSFYTMLMLEVRYIGRIAFSLSSLPFFPFGTLYHAILSYVV